MEDSRFPHLPQTQEHHSGSFCQSSCWSVWKALDRWCWVCLQWGREQTDVMIFSNRYLNKNNISRPQLTKMIKSWRWHYNCKEKENHVIYPLNPIKNRLFLHRQWGVFRPRRVEIIQNMFSSVKMTGATSRYNKGVYFCPPSPRPNGRLDLPTSTPSSIGTE